MDETAILLVIVALLISAGLFYFGERKRRVRALQRWAASNGYKLIWFEQPLVSEAGPFRFTLSKAQQSFRVQVVLPDGRSRSGWVLLGNPWAGVSSDEVEVKWDR